LFEKTAAEVSKCEATFDRVDAALVDIKDDEAIIVRQTIKEYRKGLEEFKKAYPGKVDNDSEPNA